MLTIVVCVDEPHPYYFGGVVAAPVFKNVAGDVIKYIRSSQESREAVAYNAH